MKKIYFLIAIMLFALSINSKAQDGTDKKNSLKDNIPFGKKLPPSDLSEYAGKSLPQITNSMINPGFKQALRHHDINTMKKTMGDLKQQLKEKRTQQIFNNRFGVINANQNRRGSHTGDFHLTKDINALAESNPANNSDGIATGNRSYAVLHHTMYFAADDGIHGNELWRSDGTEAGTFMVRDIEPGLASSNPSNITAANGKIYFSANTVNNGIEPWVCDGTAGGTQLLMDIKPSDASSYPTDFIEFGNDVYFVTDGDNSSLGALWKTDGTTAGTKLVKNPGDTGDGGYFMAQLVKANNLLFFTFISNTTGYEVWRSDGTDGGTYQVGTAVTFYELPIQLTSYNNKLYFSSDNDGAGYKLWVSDGTDAGTMPAPGNHDILLNSDGNFGSLPVLNNVLYLPGAPILPGGGLYKYDASGNSGLIKVKDLADSDFIYSSEMKVVDNTLYFRLDNSNISRSYQELWSSKGSESSTKLVDTSARIYNLSNGGSTLYFVKNNKFFGDELWKIIDSHFGTFPILVSDVFRGAVSSYPNYLTAFEGKLFFSATDDRKGNELFMTNGLAFGFGAKLVKDINTVSTGSSYAGYYSNTMTPLGSSVLFTAFEKRYGHELFKSDGTEHGTGLLNDIVPGEFISGPKESYPYNLTTKNNAVYFIATDDYPVYFFTATRSIYKSDGTKAGLQKIVGGYNAYNGYLYILDFKVADNGLVFYVLHNYNTGGNELWRSDGTTAGTLQLSSTVYSTHSLNVSGNTAFFVAGDAMNGYELWKSNGSVTGTAIVKDINPGTGNSNPVGMFVYKNAVYFAADNGAGPSFWKSDGTSDGTIQLAIIDPWYSASSVFSTARYHFEISNNILYFSAINYADSKGTQLWRTDGTVSGTRPVKDVSPDANSFYPIPYYLTDVNGTLFFITNDNGVIGTELWKTDGTEAGTQLVKDVTEGTEGGLNNLVSFGGKLYFTKSGVLWSSDGTADGTMPVDDAVISEVTIQNIVAAGDKLFLSGFTQQYGYELYAGKANEREKFEASGMGNAKLAILSAFNAILYPNPSSSNATLQITGNITDVSISITDINGRKLWQTRSNNEMFVKLPTEKFAPGTYLVTITGDKGSKILKLIKK